MTQRGEGEFPSSKRLEKRPQLLRVSGLRGNGRRILAGRLWPQRCALPGAECVDQPGNLSERLAFQPGTAIPGYDSEGFGGQIVNIARRAQARAWSGKTQIGRGRYLAEGAWL